jgi:hypothetical protein
LDFSHAPAIWLRENAVSVRFDAGFASMISVTVAKPGQDFTAQWNDLIRRAPAQCLHESHSAQGRARHHVCGGDCAACAGKRASSSARLVGLWALQHRNVIPFWPPMLEARPYNYAFLSTPVVDPAFAMEVMPAFFAAIIKIRSCLMWSA